MTIRQSIPTRRLPAVALVAAMVLAPIAGTMSAQAANERPQFADLIETNIPAVVNIRTAMAATAGGPRMQSPHGNMQGTPFDEFFRRFFEQAPRSPHGSQGPAIGQGSGFLVSAEGHVVTNNHVIEDAAEISVITNDGETYVAKLVGTDPRTDLALLKIDADEPFPYVEFGDSDKARTGDWIVAIGNPFGLGGSATAGIISARGRDLQAGPYDDFIQIDAPINRGNSGGPVFNTDGEVIGVNTMIYSPNGGNVGIGFAIPSAQVTDIVADLQANGSVQRGWLGVQIQGLNEEIAASLGLEGNKGALIVDVQADSPAEKGELKSGDVILDFDGTDIETVRDLTRLVAKTQADDSVEIGVWRDGKRRELDVRIGALEPEPSQVANASQSSHGKLGLELSPLTPDARRQFRIPDEVEGALVVMVDPQGPAASKGVRPGDVISMVGQQPVATPKDVRKQLDSAIDAERDHVLMRIERNGGARFVAMKLA
ncbi:MAG: Do family serine endopeptidase [Chromatiales bacterium]|nr:Do family serine endopeptidase [Chromatiales bacterium]